MKAKNKLKDPFPIETLNRINLGHADGHRDNNIENVFIKTRSIDQFCLDKHSIVVGSFGSGKSTLFKLLKNKSDLIGDFENEIIVPIEEQIQFEELRKIAGQYFSGVSSRVLYQLIWKFQIVRAISSHVSSLEDFPCSKDEVQVRDFLYQIGGDVDVSLTQVMRNLLSTISFKIKAKISSTPIEIEAGKEVHQKKQTVEINLDKIISSLERSLKGREVKSALVIIDKLDKFVTHEDYKTQREFIESLLEVEDDLQSVGFIRFKIFLRSDLHDRLNLSSLGPDKVADNTLVLKWSSSEIQSFIAKRLFCALCETDAWETQQIAESIDLTETELRWYERVLATRKKEGVFYNFAILWRKLFGKKRSISLFETFDKSIISLLFEKKLKHKNSKGEEVGIDCHEFFSTHFLDGNNSCTPRQVLIFLKKLIAETAHYYTENPDLNVHTRRVSVGWGWEIFSSDLVYSSYIQAKEDYIKHVAKLDEKWTSSFNDFLTKIKNKNSFYYKWVSQNVNFPEKDMEAGFLAFLQVIGFFETIESNRDIKKRKYKIPILYKEA
ncbi:hypothetical protein HNQ50_002627 [Silvimonas terrae]|uniref:Uncharacterized protein n=1 Tax=Silvimonas terrae TaxID=300266 RepID=A0A840RHI2_9NEIS|nr:hypothetical protein [Silvimonas terrae]MBB5191890.1 hypothetical protein [Silvimonas terrae]